MTSTPNHDNPPSLAALVVARHKVRAAKDRAVKISSKSSADRKRDMGAYLKALRSASGLTQIEVARSIGMIEAKMIGHWEAGRCWVDDKWLYGLAVALGAEPATLSRKLTGFRHPFAAQLMQSGS